MPATARRTEHAGPAALAARLANARKQLNLSLRAAAVGIDGVSPSTLCRIEKGERTPLPGPTLRALGERLQIPADELAELAGGLAPEGVSQLMSSDTRRALHAGQLTPPAQTALRRVHLATIALAQGGGTLDDLSDALDLGFRPGDPVGFDSPEVYRTPRRATDGVVLRCWQAHGLAHVALAREAGIAPECWGTDLEHPLERDVTYLAGHLLLPTAKLRAALRELFSPTARTVTELSDLVAELTSKLVAPPAWIVARLVDEDLIGRAAA